MELELNTHYLDRCGLLRHIVSIDPDKHVVNPFECDAGHRYYPDGKWKSNAETGWDLLKPINSICDLLPVIQKKGWVFAIESYSSDRQVLVSVATRAPYLFGHHAGINRSGACDVTQVFKTLVEYYKDVARQVKIPA